MICLANPEQNNTDPVFTAGSFIIILSICALIFMGTMLVRKDKRRRAAAEDELMRKDALIRKMHDTIASGPARIKELNRQLCTLSNSEFVGEDAITAANNVLTYVYVRPDTGNDDVQLIHEYETLNRWINQSEIKFGELSAKHQICSDIFAYCNKIVSTVSSLRIDADSAIKKLEEVNNEGSKFNGYHKASLDITELKSASTFSEKALASLIENNVGEAVHNYGKSKECLSSVVTSINCANKHVQDFNAAKSWNNANITQLDMLLKRATSDCQDSDVSSRTLENLSMAASYVKKDKVENLDPLALKKYIETATRFISEVSRSAKRDILEAEEETNRQRQIEDERQMAIVSIASNMMNNSSSYSFSDNNTNDDSDSGSSDDDY